MMFWRMNETPIAVISGASRGALRKRPVGDALDDDADDAHDQHRHREGEDQDADEQHGVRGSRR